jgi:D-alanine--poly(phosphoribitol) ligase subunit 1
MKSNFNLALPFFASAEKNPNSLAVCVDGYERTYREARTAVQNVASWLHETAWKRAAPNSVVDNLYGPTEATAICLYERVGEKPNVTKERHIIFIGKPLEGTEVAIWDRAGACISDRSPGEIVLSGPQLSLGYLNDADKTAESFVTKDAKRWYRTGDLGYLDGSGLLDHLGRIDNQVKVMGNRVELEEIEMHLRRIYHSDSVAAVAWPLEFGAATGIVGFVSGPKVTTLNAIEELRKGLPSYMVPSVVHVLDVLPSNTSGKVDRKALTQKLQEGEF